MPTTPSTLNIDFFKLADFSPDIIARFDRELRHIYVNESVAKATGIPREHFIGKINEDLGMPQDLCNYWRSVMNQVLNTMQPADMDFDYDSPNGKKAFHAIVWPEVDEHGNLVSLLCATRDITQKVEQNQKIIETARHSVLAELVPNVAHEINNPLSILLGSLYILEREVNSDSMDKGKALQAVQKCFHQVNRIADVTKALTSLTTSRNQSK